MTRSRLGSAPIVQSFCIDFIKHSVVCDAGSKRTSTFGLLVTDLEGWFVEQK